MSWPTHKEACNILVPNVEESSCIDCKVIKLTIAEKAEPSFVDLTALAVTLERSRLADGHQWGRIRAREAFGVGYLLGDWFMAVQHQPQIPINYWFNATALAHYLCSTNPKYWPTPDLFWTQIWSFNNYSESALSLLIRNWKLKTL